jgi:hypothetical protein
MIARRIRERVTIRSVKLDIELHRSLNSALITKRSTSKEVLITKSSTSKEVLDILLLEDINPSKVEKISIPKK